MTGVEAAAESPGVTLARNVATRYALIAINAVIGLLVLPYNVKHLGPAAYGLWMLAASTATYFTVLELGYGGAMVRFVAEYRAKQDPRSLNEVLSTTFFLFCAVGASCYAVAILVALLLPHLFNLEPGQVQTSRIVLLIISLQMALYFPFSVFGGVINGFERYWLNNVVGTVFNLATAIVNVLVLWAGFGLVALVAATTFMRIAPFFVYRVNAYRVFPELRLQLSLFRHERLRELTSFSAFLAVIDWSGRISYTTDTLYLGIFMNTAAVAVYSVAQRLSDALLKMTNQLHTLLFPAVVHRAVDGRVDSQQALLVKATRFQLAIAICLCGGIAAVADVLIRAWVGPGFETSVTATQLLAAVVMLRAWMAMPSTVLKGTNHHRYLAVMSTMAAVANVLLSIPLVKLWGVVGVATGTLIPAVILTVGVIFPKACAVVGLSGVDAYRRIVWPAAWPGLVVVAFLAATRDWLPGGLAPVLLHLGVGALAYVALFFLFGLERGERQWLVATVNAWWRRDSATLAAA